MSLLDALLLDPVRINVWISKRNDGISGSGTQTDPYDGSTAADFDQLMREIIDENTCVHLGPGEFETAGYYDGQSSNAGWQAKSGMKIVGSGIDVTFLKLANANVADKRFYAIGHALTSSTVDFFEVSNLTIDCNLPGVGQGNDSSTAGAVRIMGNHSRILRVKVKNWGTHNNGVVGFVVALLTGDPSVGVNGVINCGIQECIAIEPGASPSSSKVTVFHVGAKEGAALGDEATGIAPYIRNCFVDCGQDLDVASPLDYQALSIAWCDGGTVEGNTITNTKNGGPFQTRYGAKRVVVRNNNYRNVWRGPYWVMEAVGGISQRLQHLLAEENTLQLSSSSHNKSYGIDIQALAGNPHDNVVVRNNQITYYDSSNGDASGIQAACVVNLQVLDNVLELTPAQPLVNYSCGSVKYFNNRRPDGILIQGKNKDNPSSPFLYPELETDAEDALVFSLFKG